MDTRPTKNITIMKELKIENQWIWKKTYQCRSVEGFNSIEEAYPMLEEVRIQVFVETIFEFDGSWFEFRLNTKRFNKWQCGKKKIKRTS